MRHIRRFVFIMRYKIAYAIGGFLRDNRRFSVVRFIEENIYPYEPEATEQND